ncbi:hypothetical protein GCK72_018456 [Caenorhabditis remanei]|uniref:Uncharacterized protein n=1 Tax=Caenorhabditis remanei TaxID=31234 RepID=A0A6A5GBV1_CAERE|nr:hypothetical protein GCK72_018456 [Caenorhabditis remanei]KAF1751902.1 hypothetical protein GCK72_018456 [Caenorhabditis remanei]
MLRLEKNIELDNYRNIHIVAIILSVLWLVAMMSWIVFNFTHNKIFYGGEETELILCALRIVSNVYIWFISTICLACYSLIFSALNREITYFNVELQKSKEEKFLQNIEVLEKFDHRQNEILNLISFVNESVSFFGGLVPLFLFYGLVNGVYLTATFVNTTKILIDDDEFGCSKDPCIYQTYRIMVDRFQKIDTKIYVISAFPITKRVVAAALFILPNMGFILVLIHKVLIANGGHV